MAITSITSSLPQICSEIGLLHNGHDTWTNRTLRVNESLLLEPSGRTFHIKAEFSIPADAKLTFRLRGIPVALTSTTVESGNPPVAVAGQIHTVEILLDRGSIETFVNQGEISSTRLVLPNENGLSVKAEGSPVTIHSLTVYPLDSAWKKAGK